MSYNWGTRYKPNYAAGYPMTGGLQAGAIISQPQSAVASKGWMDVPPGITNCPPGLEYLALIDQLLVKQKVDLLEVMSGFERNNKYTVKNSLGQNVYWVVEDNDSCTLNCFGADRPFDMRVFDIFRNEVMRLSRSFACSNCCFPCCLDGLEVFAPYGQLAGQIEQEYSLCTPSYVIKNHNNEKVLRIEGPPCTLSCCGDVEFQVLSLDGKQVGKITKQWSGLAREMFTKADYFGINFPMDLDVRTKAVLLGACMLIDVMHYETRSNDNCFSSCDN